LFLAASVVLAYAVVGPGNDLALLVGAVLGAGYLALNIGANDGANHIGTAVGSGALTLGAALLLASIGELGGALLAGDAVNTRLREGLFETSLLNAQTQFATVLLSGILAAGLWLHVCTAMRIPVSTTHSVIGGLVGASISAQGWSSVRWGEIGSIALGWTATPVAAALVSGLVLFLIERTITQKPNLVGAARIRVPALITLLALLLADYFFLELAPSDWRLSRQHLLASAAVAVAAFLIAQPLINRASQQIKNNRQGVNQLFTVPLIFAAGFFAFAHGANDVANIAAPLAALTEIASDGTLPERAPAWVLGISAIGIAVGLALYGSRVVQTVGSEITEIDKLRAFCIAFSAALVVAAASHFGFPVSTTHTLVGSILGVGLLREYLKLNERKTLEKVRKCYIGEDPKALETFLQRFQGATLGRKREMLEALYRQRGNVRLTRKDLQRMDQLYRRQLVKRSLVRRILIMWVLTIPVSAGLGAACLRAAQRLSA
jgi:PiT family inorganic phosphate transporter